jgi:cardiolipin synthase
MPWFQRLWEAAEPIDVFALTVLLAELAALLTVPSVLLKRRGRPTAALAWLLALFALPAVGAVMWWSIGRTNLERKRRRRRRVAREFNARKEGPPTTGTVFDQFVPKRALDSCVFPSGGNQVELLIDGSQAYPAMERAVAEAKREIHALFYIWKADAAGRKFRDMLVEKARQGVTVRVLVDAFGSQAFAGSFCEPLVDAGAMVARFLPSRFEPFNAPRFNFVNHRKILVVDGETAFTGGMNIGDEYRGPWRDLMLSLHGPAARALNYVFLDDWYFATAESPGEASGDGAEAPGDVDVAVIASGPDTESWIHDAYFTALTRAETRIWIATPYFIPTQALMAALRTAAGRGVDVRIVVPDVSDVRLVKWASRSYYRLLVSAGVKVYEYQGTMLHAKALLVDQDRASVGTANLDTRSFRLSFEVGCFFASSELCGELASWFSSLLESAKQISEESLNQDALSKKLLESVAHLMSPLL